MSSALHYSTSGAYFLAFVFLVGGLILPTQDIRIRCEDARVEAGAWGIGRGLPLRESGAECRDGREALAGGSWFDGKYSDYDGTTRLQFAGPLILLGSLTLLVAGLLVLGGRGILTGWVGTGAFVACAVGALFLVLGIRAFVESVTPINEVLEPDLGNGIGFWSIFLGLLVAAGAAIASFSVRIQPKGRIGPDGQPLPPLPILSAENPTAFNPMANRDPRPFRQEDFGYLSFEVTGGRRTFRTKKEGEEDEWVDADKPLPSPDGVLPPPPLQPVAGKGAAAAAPGASGAPAAPAKAAAAKAPAATGPAGATPAPAAKPPAPPAPPAKAPAAGQSPGAAKPAAPPAGAQPKPAGPAAPATKPAAGAPAKPATPAAPAPAGKPTPSAAKPAPEKAAPAKPAKVNPPGKA